MFASLVQGPLLRLFLVGALLLALQSTVFADLRPAGISLQVVLALAAAAGAAGGPQKGALAGFVLGLLYDLNVGTPLGSSSISMGLAGYLAGYVTAITVRPPWWLAALFVALGAAAGEASVPIIRAFVGEEHPLGHALRDRDPRRRHRRVRPQPAVRAGRPVVHAREAAGVEGSPGRSMSLPTRADRPPGTRPRTGLEPTDCGHGC